VSIVFKTGNKAKQADTTQFTQGGAEMALTGRKKKSWLPFIGIVLVLAGLVFFAATSGMAAAQWLLGLWPLFAIIAGVASVMGFAVERKPKSPVSGMLLIFVGVLFSAARFHANLNALQIYGRYWILLLFIYAGVELVRHYSHRLNDGKPPRLFSFGKVFMVLMIAGSGIIANHVANNLGSVKLPGLFSAWVDSVVGDKYSFPEEVALPALKPNAPLIVNNSHGNVSVKVVSGSTSPRAVLMKNVRAWKKEDAIAISEKINLLVTQAFDGSLTITTNREDVKTDVKREFNTDIQIEVPSTSGVTITNSYGDITANEIQGGLTVKSSYGRVEVNNLSGAAIFNLKNSDATGTNLRGNVEITGAKRVNLSNVDGTVNVESNNGSVDLRNVKGAVKIDSTYSRITAQDLSESATLNTSHGSVKVTNAAAVTINAPYSEITANNIRGELEIESSNDDIRATSVAGDLIVEAERASVRVDEVQGYVKINTTHGDVSLKNFHKGVEVETSFRDVVLTVNEQVNGDISVDNNRGAIKFIYPQIIALRLDAQSERGRVKTKGIEDVQQDERDSLIRGSAGPMVKLRTSFSDILVQASGARQAQNKGPVPPPPPSKRD
jgi:uncharacterized membrane protein HdeD (DUF308 family)